MAVSNSSLGPSLVGAEVLLGIATEHQSTEVRWITRSKPYILEFSDGRPSSYTAPSGGKSTDLETVRKVLRAFAVSVDGFVQLAPLEQTHEALSIDTLGEALVAVLHTLPERAVTQIIESRGSRWFGPSPRFEPLARAIAASRGPEVERFSDPVSLRDATRGLDINVKRAWLTLLVLGGFDSATVQNSAGTGAPAQKAQTPKAPTPRAAAIGASAATISGARGAEPTEPVPEDAPEAVRKRHLLALALPSDPDAVRAAVDLKKRLQKMFDKTHYEILEIPSNASKDTIRTAYFELAKTYHLDKFSNVPLGEFKQVAEEVFRKISEASRVLSDDEERSNYDVFLERKAKGLPTDVNVILEADNLFEKAKMLVSRGHGARAVHDLERAMELNSVDLDYKTYYAYARYLAEGAPSYADVREQLRGIIREDSNNSTAHDFLGRIHRAEGNLKGAAFHLQKAIEITPKNADALRELRVVQMRLNKRGEQSKGGFFKGLLKR